MIDEITVEADEASLSVLISGALGLMVHATAGFGDPEGSVLS